MRIRFNYGKDWSREFSFGSGDGREVNKDEARELVEDVLRIFGKAAREVRDRIAEYADPADSRDTPPVPDDDYAEPETTAPPARAASEESSCDAALQALDLPGRAIVPTAVGSASMLTVQRLPDEDDLGLWNVVKDAVVPAGCYPLWVMIDALDYLQESAGDAPADRRRFSSIRAELFAANPWPLTEPIMESFSYTSTVRRFGSGPSAEELGAHAFQTDDELDEFLWKWERATFGDAAVIDAGDPERVGWFEAGIDEAVLLVTPYADGPATIPTLSFYPVDDRPEWLMPLQNDLAAWNEAFGAELIANYGTMLQFTVANPPGDLDTAYQLAKEHEAVATSTFAPAGIVRRHYAADLIGCTRWRLHDRP